MSMKKWPMQCHMNFLLSQVPLALCSFLLHLVALLWVVNYNRKEPGSRPHCSHAFLRKSLWIQAPFEIPFRFVVLPTWSWIRKALGRRLKVYYRCIAWSCHKYFCLGIRIRLDLNLKWCNRQIWISYNDPIEQEDPHPLKSLANSREFVHQGL